MIGASVVLFRREAHSEPEYGIGFLPEVGINQVRTILDINGRVVPAPIHSYTVLSYRGSFCIPSELVSMFPAPRVEDSNDLDTHEHAADHRDDPFDDEIPF